MIEGRAALIVIDMQKSPVIDRCPKRSFELMPDYKDRFPAALATPRHFENDLSDVPLVLKGAFGGGYVLWRIGFRDKRLNVTPERSFRRAMPRRLPPAPQIQRG